MALQDITGRSIAFLVDDYNYEALTNNSFDPLTDLHDAEHVTPTHMTWQHAVAHYGKNGFLARPNEGGAFYAVTWRQFQNAINKEMTYAERVVVLATLIPKRFNSVIDTWIECPLIKVYGLNGDGDQNYITIASHMNVGIIK